MQDVAFELSAALAKLSVRRQTFVHELLKGGSAAEAARRAGYAARSANTTAFKLLKLPAVVNAVEVGRRELAKRNELTLDKMVAQLQTDRQFAYDTENASAAVKASELVARLGGHLIDRKDVRLAVSAFNIQIEGIELPVRGEAAVIEAEMLEVQA